MKFLSLMVTFCLFQAGGVFAQSNFQVGIFGGVHHSFRTLEVISSNETSDWIVDSRNENEKPLVAWSTGAFGRFNIDENFGIHLGLLQARQGWRTVLEDLVFSDQKEDPRNPGSVIGDDGLGELVSIEFRDRFDYFEMPVAFYWSMGEKKLKPEVFAGGFVGFLWNATSVTIVNYDNGRDVGESRASQSEYEEINYGVLAGIGCDYQFSEKLSAFVRAQGNLGLANIINDPITAQHWRLGMNLGCAWDL